ncbi:MAG: hypothetical protein KDA84_22180, partial [Planctomycetaceae bacterium]|nr:hypothetical protein [Planctomycetaceae bacterium]
MPIKFRCVHCGQYLGISHSKAGTVVDCPTCGRSVGVPHKDGTAERVGRPSLNHDDSQLADALREVAAIARSSETALPHPPPFTHSTDARETREVDSPPPKIIPTSPLPPAEPLNAAPVPHNLERPSYGDDYADESQDTYYATGPSPLAHLTALAEGEGDSEEIPVTPAEATGDFQFGWTNEVPWKMWLGFIVIGFVAVVSGFALGRWDLKIGRPEKPLGSMEVKEAPPGNSSQASPPPLGTVKDPEVTLTGTIQYSQSGQEGEAIHRDENAWIYAFPVEWAGRQKIPTAWLQTNNPHDYRTQAGHQLLIAALRVMGGNASQAGPDGKFQLRLARKGDYRILVCSQHISRDSNQPMDEGLRRVLMAFFEEPLAFLDQRQFQYLSEKTYSEPST